MPLMLPNLDDRTYDDLREEALAQIPVHAPQWTNYNPSDPGITLVELFAWLTEMLLYRTNRVTDANTEAFLKLLNGADWKPSAGQSLQDQIRETVVTLRTPQRAVSMDDFELLAKMASPLVRRTYAVPRRNFDSSNPDVRYSDAAGHVSVMIIPDAGPAVLTPQPDAALLQTVSDFLDPRRLLTTVVNVVGPRYVPVSVIATIVLTADAPASQMKVRITDALHQLTHPLTGGPSGAGWPFGRGIYASDLYLLLEHLPGVDYVVDNIQLTTPDSWRVHPGTDGSAGISARSDELVGIDAVTLTLQLANGDTL